MNEPETKQKQKKCALGFDCSGMMQLPGLDPGDCENYLICRAAVGLPPDEAFTIQRHREYLILNRTQAAQLMLMSRGCPQNLQSLGITEKMDEIFNLLQELGDHFQNLTDRNYVAPPGAEVHNYWVKRPWGRYRYFKLASKEKIFAPMLNPENVKVIHLSREDDPRHLEAAQGINRRNALLEAKTRLNEIIRLLQECLPE